MKAIKTIVKTYSGADRRELLPKKSEIAGVVGDNLTTKFIFKIPAEYENWDKFIRWHCTVTDDDGQTIVNPVYPLDADNSFTLPGELIPDNDMIVGYNLTFYGSDGVNELVENSITSTVYIESTREPFAAGTTEDIVRRLLEAAISTIQTLEYAEDPQAATTAQTARPYLIATKKYGDVENIILNLPYLNQDGYIDDRFYAPSRMPSRVYVLTDSVTPASEQLTELTDARMEDMAYFTDGAEAGSMYVLTVDDPTHEENWKSILPDKVLTAIANNASNILAETQRATGVENSISSDLGAEISTRTTETTALRNDLTAEENTRTEQYNGLSGRITAEEGRATEAETVLSAAISSEEGRATGVETNLGNAIIEEERQRRVADGELQTAIGNEASYRSEKDTQLEEAISEEVGERAAADAELEQTINSIGSELISQLNTKRDKIVVSHPDSNVVYTQDGSGHEGLFYIDQTSATGGSIVARTSSGTIVTASPSDSNDATTKGYVDQADGRKIDKTSIVSVDWSAEPSNTNVPSELLTKTKIDAEVTRATGAENSLSSAITSEETDRVAQYNSLSADISNETTSRANADEQILSLLTSETTNREHGDSDLLERLNQEIQDRIQGDANEKSQREEADGDLHDYIDGEIERVEGVITTTESELSGDISDVDARVTAETTRATGVESGLRSDLTAETAAREAADTALQSDVDSRVPKTFSATVFVGASVPNGNVTESGVSVQFATKNTNNNTTGTVTMPLPVATSAQAGIATASQIAQIAQNRADIETLMGKSTRYAIDVDLTGMTDAQIQTALTTAWRTASGTPTGNPAQYTTLVNLWNNHEYTWLTVGSTTQWEDRGISTVSIATSDSLGVVMGTPDPGDDSTNGGIYVDENGQMTVIGWDDVTSDISNLQSNVSALQSGKVSKVSQTGTGYVSSVSINATDKTQLDVTRTALPSLSKGSTTGSGNAVTDISVSGHTITLNKETTFLTTHQDISGKMNTDMSNINITGTKSNGKTVVWDEANTRWMYGEAGKVDDVKVNGSSVVTNKVANITITMPTVNDNKIDFKVGNTIAQTFTANQSSDVALSFEGSGGTTVTADNSAKKITISSTAVNNGTLTIKGGTTAATTFSANSSASPTLTISGSGGTTVTGGTNTITISSTGVNNGTLTIKSKAKSEEASETASEVTLGTFSANQSSSPTIKVLIPTKVSDLENDLNFISGLGFDDLTSHPTTLAGYGITDALPSNHVYPISLTAAGSSGTTLAHNTWYTLTAGGSSVIFKTPADNDTKAWSSITGKPFVSFGDTIEVVSNVANVKLGYSASGKNYAIAKDSNGKLYVNVPWENTHYTATPILGASTATSNATSATANDATYLNIIENSSKSGGIQVTGSGGTTVSAVNGKLTITSSSVPSAASSVTAVGTTAVVGTSTNYARQDHVHNITLATGDSNGQVKIAGTNVSVKGLVDTAYTGQTSLAPGISLAKTGTSSIDLAASTVYTLTVGASSIAFKTTPNTTYSVPKNATTSSVAPSAANSNGFWYVTGTSTDLTNSDSSPFTQYHENNKDYRILTNAYSTAWFQQIATDFRTDHIYYRRNENGTWKPWVKLALSSELPSLVSKSANGLCPVLPNETTTTKYLRQDGTWVAPPNTTYSVVSKSANGLCPQLPNETTTTKYLRQDGTWVVPPYPSTVSKTTAGLCPQLPNETTTTKYLRQDGTWVAPPNTWTAMVGASSSANGSVGYVNAVPPKDGYNTKYLRADGTWTVPPNTWTAMVGASSSANGSVGYVNAVPPKDGYNTKYLRADGTWQVPPNTTYSVVGKGTNGLCPALPNETTTTKYLRQDGTWVAPPNTTYSVVSKSANGLCPILPNETTTTKYLRQDGTWVAPPNTTYSVVSKSANGLCPQLPNETTTTKYLRQDGTWVAPPNTWTALAKGTASAAGTAGYAPAPPAGTQGGSSFLSSAATWVAQTSIAPGVSIAQDTSATTTGITLSHNTKYKITVGGSTFLFTTPGDNDTYAWDSITGKPFNSVGTGLSVSSNTLSVAYGTSATTACVGNDSRLSNARTPTAHAVNANTYGYGDTTNAGHLRVGSNITVSSGTISLTKANVTNALGYTPPTANTDTLMTQSVSTSTSSYPILACPTANASSDQGAKTGIFSSKLTLTPSMGSIATILDTRRSIFSPQYISHEYTVDDTKYSVKLEYSDPNICVGLTKKIGTTLTGYAAAYYCEDSLSYLGETQCVKLSHINCGAKWSSTLSSGGETLYDIGGFSLYEPSDSTYGGYVSAKYVKAIHRGRTSTFTMPAATTRCKLITIANADYVSNNYTAHMKFRIRTAVSNPYENFTVEIHWSGAISNMLIYSGNATVTTSAPIRYVSSYATKTLSSSGYGCFVMVENGSSTARNMIIEVLEADIPYTVETGTLAAHGQTDDNFNIDRLEAANNADRTIVSSGAMVTNITGSSGSVQETIKTDNVEYSILGTARTSSGTQAPYFEYASGRHITFNPSTKTITATGGFIGNLTGNSATATTLAVSSTSEIATTNGVQLISTTILSQSGYWLIETYSSGNYGFQRATSVADPACVAVRTKNNSTTWGSWTYSYAVWKA